MGWLVQAEAPPASLFRKFRQYITTGQAPAADIAFYFVHWFTDLAAAEPCPMDGCEKFVLKFPQKVLAAFLNSFSIVQQLYSRSETQVLEDYLIWRWQSQEPSLGRPPEGEGSIMKLRLVVMAQGDSERLLEAINKLSPEDHQTLSEELACTGCKDQQFARDTLRSNSGPAILVYYAPALLQKAGKTDPIGAMTVLSEVFRQAREFWPLSEEMADQTVIVRIDALKELQVPAIFEPSPGDMWALQKTSSCDATVKRINMTMISEVDWSTSRVLNLSADRGTRVRAGRNSHLGGSLVLGRGSDSPGRGSPLRGVGRSSSAASA